MSERGGGETDTAVGGIEDRVETLEEGHAVDEVEAFTSGGSEVTHNEVHAVGIATNSSVQVTL